MKKKFIRCDRCGQMVRSKHFVTEHPRYCPQTVTHPIPTEREQEIARRELADAIRNRR